MSSAIQSEYSGLTPFETESGLAVDPAQYYDIKDIHAASVAGLLVLMDSAGRPLRAELHVYDDLPSHIHEAAVRQARRIVQQQYSGEAIVPLRIMQTRQMRDAVDVRLDQSVTLDGQQRKRRMPVFAVVGTVALLALVVLAAVVLRGSQGIEAADLLSIEGATRAVQERAGITLDKITNAASDGGEVAPPTVLPVSANARPDLQIGTRVAIVPGLRLTLRSEPGGEAGVPVGYMMDEDTAVIVGGPHMTAGTSDTIVWWLVNLDDGTEAWAAANTSDQTLLIPAE